ncbi:MAG: PIN domain-containing protein [Terracidiphilus sp.]|jgi:predicted nucleic acid-binding protein
MLVLFDSNILLRWQEPDHPDQILVAAAVDRLLISGAAPCYTSQNLGELWNVLTRPTDRNGFGLTPAQADRRARAIESRISLLPDTPDVHIEWRRLLVDYSISGAQVHDARLVAAMHVHGVKRILTFNTRDFARFKDVEAIHPAELEH